MRLIWIFCGWLLVSCGDQVGNNVREFMPGMYTHFAEGKYSKAWDTLVVSVYDEEGNTYVVQQRTGFQRIKEGKIQPKEYKRDHFVAVYDAAAHHLQDLKSGKLLLFSRERGTVLLGTAEYVKRE